MKTLQLDPGLGLGRVFFRVTQHLILLLYVDHVLCMASCHSYVIALLIRGCTFYVM